MSGLLGDALFSVAGKLIDRLWPDPAQRDEAKLKLMDLQQSGELSRMAMETDLMKGQMEINKVEAANSSLLVAGWRPACGWMCVAGLGYAFVLRPLAQGALAIAGQPAVLPPLETNELMALITGMLGFGGFRSYEKSKGVAS